jgi:integrase
MRQGEILGLRWDWIDFEKNFISIPQSNTKSKKERKIPINTVLRLLLNERKFATESKEFVFPSPKVNPKPSRQEKEKHLAWVKRSFKTACKKAGIENLRFHDLRHTAATRLVEAGIPLHAVAKLLGHSTVRVTERYSHPEESVQKAVDILGNFTQDYSQNCSQHNLGS